MRFSPHLLIHVPLLLAEAVGDMRLTLSFLDSLPSFRLTQEVANQGILKLDEQPI